MVVYNDIRPDVGHHSGPFRGPMGFPNDSNRVAFLHEGGSSF